MTQSEPPTVPGQNPAKVEQTEGWQQLDRAYLWHPYTQMKTAPLPVPIARGEGIYLYTPDGRRILDGISSWWVNIHGHSHPYLNEALARQATQLEHVMFAGFTHRPAALLAEQLVQVLPPGLKRIFYSDNGSTAVEVAMKMAIQFWHNQGEDQRRTFVVLDHAYHGDTVGAMSASADSAFTRSFKPMLFPVARTHAPYCFRCPVALEPAGCNIECLTKLESILSSQKDTIAAVLVEPMLQAAGGMIMWPKRFLSGVRQLCDRFGALMIADEVLTGFGRTGRMFACEHGGISPDLICLSKALTGGYLPMGVTAATEKIYEAFLSDDRRKTFFHGHSFTANPLACAVAIASLELFHKEGSLDRVRALEAIFHSRVTSLQAHPYVGDVRVLGGVIALELVRERLTREAGGYLDRVGPQLTRLFLDRGLLLRPLGNVLYFMPPYVIGEDETHWALDQIEDVLQHWQWPES
jgi:adenosylmethionine---8-amino-7-oxononanoate aminotransferase